MPFTKIGTNKYQSPSGKKFTGKQVKMYYATDGFKKKKIKISNKKMRGSLGETDFDDKNRPLRVRIDVKKHKGDKAELASTIKHELLHVKHPKMTEKDVYRKSKKTAISPAEQAKLIAKLRMKKLNYKTGAIKRKLKINKKAKLEVGSLINKSNELSRKQVAIRGMI